MRQNLILLIFFLARLFLVCVFLFNSSLFTLFAKSLQAYSITDIESPLATIQGRVWVDGKEDGDENGNLDEDDPGVANVLVKLYTQDGVSQRILTDEQGLFEFTSLATGTYDLEFINPLGYQFTAGSSSDADRITGRISNIEVSDSGAAVDGLLVGLVRHQIRTISSISLELFEVSPNVLNGEPAVFIKWETSREVGNEGFQILRSTTDSRNQAIEIGEFIPSQGNPDSTGANRRYEEWDTDIDLGIIYTYWLQEREIGGATLEHGPKFTVDVGPGNGHHEPPPEVGGASQNYVYLPLIVK